VRIGRKTRDGAAGTGSGLASRVRLQGFSCNLQLVGQSRGDGASWQQAWFQDKAGHKCNYYDTAATTANRAQIGVVAIDATNPASPQPTAYLSTTSMVDPWESLKVNERRQLLAGVSATNGNGGPEFDVYDISGDCRFPQLLTSVAVGTGLNAPMNSKPRCAATKEVSRRTA
jgi:hypothetical protein